MKDQTQPIPVELAPCGIYCGACPSFKKTCLGCASLDPNQKRQSKWRCRLRVCCYEEKGLDYCSACEGYPCSNFKKKLLDSYPADPRFNYRKEVAKNLILLQELGKETYLQMMGERYTCPECGGRVVWYHYHCTDCDAEVVV
jgi:hypothetical protein